MPEIPQIDRLIAEVAARHGILLKKDDAAFALVTLNQLVLESAIADLVAQMHAATAEFEAAMERVQSRAGAAIAKDIRALVLGLPEEPGYTSRTAIGPLNRESPALQYSLLWVFAAGLAVGVILARMW